MRDTAANYINHIAIVADESWSMDDHAEALVQVTDNQTAYLAQRSRELDQETRVTFYTFASRGQQRCLFYDKDVLRLPSIRGLYSPRGRTALIECTRLAISDLRQTAQLYGEHAFLIYVLSDGRENEGGRPAALAADIAGIPVNWTIAAFAPDQIAVHELKGCGFPADNISVWNTASSTGIEDVGRVMRETSGMFMEGRVRGVHGYNSKSGHGGLFQLRDFSAAEVTATLGALARGSYRFYDVHADEPINRFVTRVTGRTYHPLDGIAYYQFMKTETVQPQKEIAVEVGGNVYTGQAARDVLGLPGHQVRVRPDHKPGCTVYVQSTSPNRKLIAGTRLLVLS